MAKKKVSGKNGLWPAAEATLNSFRQAINPPYKKNDFAAIFTLLFILISLPLLVVGTVNRQSLVSKAQSPNCSNSTYTNDSQKPSIHIEVPSEGQYLTEKGILIKIKASDNYCLKKVTLLIDGETVKTFKSSPFTYFWDLSNLNAGSHTVAVRAADASDNLSVSSVSVFRSAKDIINR